MGQTTTDEGRLPVDHPEIEAAQVAATDEYVKQWNAAQVAYLESRNKGADRETDQPHDE